MEFSDKGHDNRVEPDIGELSQETENLSLHDNPTTSQKICFSYSKYGHCRFGHNCKFNHQQKEGVPYEFQRKKFPRQDFKKIKHTAKNLDILDKKGVENGKKTNPRSISESHYKYNFHKPCRYFQAGYCSKEENCNFSHSTENLNTQAASHVRFPFHSRTKKKSVLNNYFRREIYHKGDKKYCNQQKSFVTESSDELSYQKSTAESGSTSNDVARNDIEPFTLTKEDESCSSICNGITTSVIPDSSTEADASECILLPEVTTSFNNNMHSDNSNTTSFCLNDSNNVTVDHIRDPCTITSAKLPLKFKNKMPNTAFKIFDLPLSEKEILQLRETEIGQLKKRYPRLEGNAENTIFTFEFNPTDPDWSHDVLNFQLQAIFPENYPVEVCKITVLQSTDIIAELVLRHLNESIFDWLNQRHQQLTKVNKVELLFRPFLKWFDRNLDELLTTGLQKVNQDVFEDSDESEEQLFSSSASNELGDDSIVLKNLNHHEQQTSELHQINSSGPTQSDVHTYAAQKLGVNILFMGLELVEGVAAISCTKLAIMLHCGRCKTSSNIKTIPNKNNSITCSKCSRIMQCNFNPSILHQFTNVLGTVYLVECQGVDVNVVECAFLVDCLNCSKQITIQGVHYGPKQKFWCMFCNQKLIISIESSKFQPLSVAYASVKTAPVKKTERKKDPSIKEGGPLPQFGACKHYKKSNRWLRFPCCGRVYPCDLCHEEKESDHEMKFASRMICGFCSKEQPYSRDKPCSGCSSNVVAKSGAHWEGGKGCRNKVKMARDDKKKYAGTSKTISKKCQNSGNKKK